jgi:pyruvate formate lyase activating enzyme
MPDIPATPPATLVRARALAQGVGLHHVYTGNVHNQEGDTTFCTGCHAPLIVRDWYEIQQYRLNPDGRCPHCGAAMAGKFASKAGEFGRRRIPIAINRAQARGAG